jgi:conjugative relaxase-like TrwC/TraI family protein
MMSNPCPIQRTDYLFNYLAHENDRSDTNFWFADKSVLAQWGIQANEIRKEDFVALAEGFDPKTNQPLLKNSGQPTRRKGMEFTLSPPKSFGVLFESGNEETKKLLVGIERKAIEATLTFVQEQIKATKDKTGANQQVHSLVAMLCKHRVNRDEDIHHHYHVELLNLAITPSGQIRGLDFRTLFDLKKVLGATYRAELANGLLKAGIDIEQDRFSWRVKAIPKEADQHFSGRTQQIDLLFKARIAEIQAKEGKQLTKAQCSQLRQALTLVTRKVKTSEPIVQLTQGWREILDSKFGINETFVSKLIQPSYARLIEAPDQKAILSHISNRGKIHQLKVTDLQAKLLELKAIYPRLNVKDQIAHLEQAGIIARVGKKVQFDPAHLATVRASHRQAQRSVQQQPRAISFTKMRAKLHSTKEGHSKTKPVPLTPFASRSNYHPISEGGSQNCAATNTSGMSQQEAMKVKAFAMQQQAGFLVWRALNSPDNNQRNELYSQAGLLYQQAEILYANAYELSTQLSISIE